MALSLPQPQPAPMEGKSHFFPDSGINYSNATRASGEEGGRGRINNPPHPAPKLQLFLWLHGTLQRVSLGRQPCLGRTLWAWQHQNMA